MEQAVVGSRSSVVGFRIAALVGGAVLVAAAAQVSIPLLGTPVPMTLQPMAVLLVGGLLGPRLGALAQRLILTGSLSAAARFGTLPFLLGDLVKIAVLVPVLAKLTPTIRARL